MKNRALSVGVAAGCAAVLWGMLAPGWLVGHDRIGLLGVELCDGFCEVKSWTELHAPRELFWLSGLTLLGALHTIGFAVHALVQVHRNRRERIRVGWTAASAASTIIPGVIFLVRVRTRLPNESSTLAYAPFLEAGAVIAVAVLVWRLRTVR